MPLAGISLTFSRHFSLSFITSGGSSGLHPHIAAVCMFDPVVLFLLGHKYPHLKETLRQVRKLSLCLFKFRALHARHKCDNVCFVGSRLKEMWTQELAWVSRILYNQEGFDLNQKRFTEDSYLRPCVCSTAALFTGPYFMGNKRKLIWL